MNFFGETMRNGSYFFILLSTGGFEHGRWFVLQIPCEFSDSPVCIEVQKAGIGALQDTAKQFSLNTSYINDGIGCIMPFLRHKHFIAVCAQL